MVIDEPIHVESHNVGWAGVFSKERDRLATTLAIPSSVIHHIGSTAVPGLAAKPIIDIMIGVDKVPPPAAWSDRLVELGYEPLGEAGVAGRWYFRLRTEPFRNVHIVEIGDTHWKQNLAFRDYLRRSPAACRRYEAVKRAAVTDGATTLIAYSRAKQSAVVRLLAEALDAASRPEESTS